MKKINLYLVILISLVSPVSADMIQGSCDSGQYSWTYSYDINYENDAINVGMDLYAVGYTEDYGLLDRFEYGIESRWTTHQFDVPIIFDVEWVDTGWHRMINIIDDYGRSNMNNWYSDGYWSREFIAAHEFGHLIGLYDEYSGGAVDPDTGWINTGGTMHTDGPTLDYYYDEIMEWYASTDMIPSGEYAQTPEPTTLVLLGSGLIGLGRLVRRRITK